jgi:aspartyl-tRNA(Asn)/glutamyl-tRNA(Gln) amidotransferase subunit A
VVVAAGLAPAAIGTDTGGSVRVPASFNGVVGYKSSTGRYPMQGAFPLSATLDTLGPLANTVEDCVLIDAALRGAPAPEARRAAASDLHILIPENVVFAGAETAVVANFEAAIDRLAKAGATIERGPLPELAEVLDVGARHGNITAAEAMHLHKARMSGPDLERIDRRVAKRIRAGESMTAVDLIEILQTRARLIASADAAIGERLVAFPTTPNVAMPPLEADDEVFARENLKSLRNTMLGNFLNWCGVAIPSGVDGDGMPTSFLLSATHGRDTAALSAALTAERFIRMQ